MFEEIGIDVNLVKSKLKSTILFYKPNSEFIQYPDMAGPLILSTLLGIFLTSNRKLSFGFIYGYGFFGSCFIYFLLNMML